MAAAAELIGPQTANNIRVGVTIILIALRTHPISIKTLYLVKSVSLCAWAAGVVRGVSASDDAETVSGFARGQAVKLKIVHYCTFPSPASHHLMSCLLRTQRAGDIVKEVFQKSEI